MESSLYKCIICNSIKTETKIKNVYICSNCFHVTNYTHTKTNIGDICILKKQNKNYIWINVLHSYENPHTMFELIKDIKKNYDDELTYLFIKLPYINGKILNIRNNDYIHYFNINSMKILCEFHNFNIIELYKVNNSNELFYIFEIKIQNENNNDKNFDIYKHIYDELTDNIYELCNYI